MTCKASTSKSDASGGGSKAVAGSNNRSRKEDPTRNHPRTNRELPMATRLGKILKDGLREFADDLESGKPISARYNLRESRR